MATRKTTEQQLLDQFRGGSNFGVRLNRKAAAQFEFILELARKKSPDFPARKSDAIALAIDVLARQLGWNSKNEE